MTYCTNHKATGFWLSIASGNQVLWSSFLQSQRLQRSGNQAQICLHFLPYAVLSGAKSKTAEKSSTAFPTVSELDCHLEFCPVIISIWEDQWCFILSWPTSGSTCCRLPHSLPSPLLNIPLFSTCLCSSTASPWDSQLSAFSRLQTPAGQKCQELM